MLSRKFKTIKSTKLYHCFGIFSFVSVCVQIWNVRNWESIGYLRKCSTIICLSREMVLDFHLVSSWKFLLSAFLCCWRELEGQEKNQSLSQNHLGNDQYGRWIFQYVRPIKHNPLWNEITVKPNGWENMHMTLRCRYSHIRLHSLAAFRFNHFYMNRQSFDWTESNSKHFFTNFRFRNIFYDFF